MKIRKIGGFLTLPPQYGRHMCMNPRRIKEQTVRNLEPEIQRLMSRHTAELSDIEGHRDRQLLQQERHFLNAIPFEKILPDYTQYVCKRHPIRDIVLILERLGDRL